MLWLACHNSEIYWRTEEVNIIRYLAECEKQWRPKEEKLRWQKQKEEERNKVRRKGKEKIRKSQRRRE